MSLTVARPPLSDFGGTPPEAGFGESGGGGSAWVELVTASNDIEGHLVAGRVTAAGVEVRVVKDRSAPGAWLYGGANPWAPVTILVRKMELMEARIALAEASFEAPAAEEATRVAPQRDWKTPLVWWSLALGLGILMTGVALSRTAVVLGRCDVPLVCAEPAIQP